jgi:hypothetical protein
MLLFVFVAIIFLCPVPSVPDPATIQTAPFARTDAKEVKCWAGETLAMMRLEQKIGQIIFPDIAAGNITEDDPRLAGWIRQAKDLGVGMFVLTGEG